jgi:hypothetical protein
VTSFPSGGDPGHPSPVRRLPLLLLLTLAGACQRGSVTPDPSATLSARATPASAERAPAPERVTGEALARLASYPDPLASEPLEIDTPDAAAGAGVVWARAFRSSADHSAPFTVFLCEPRCHLPLLDTMRSYRSLDAPLDGTRKLAIGFLGFFLGGSIGFVRWQSPTGRFEVVVLLEMPPSDGQVSPAARAYYRDHDVADPLTAVGQGLDRALFAPAPPP